MPAGLELADIFCHYGPAYTLVHNGHLGRMERRFMSGC